MIQNFQKLGKIVQRLCARLRTASRHLFDQQMT